MPYSLVLNLIPRSPVPRSNLSGRHLHALFLELVNSVAPDLANQLHQQTSEKAFVLSPLQVDEHQRKSNILQFQYDRPLAVGRACWWRIGLLDDALFGQLTQLWLNLSPDRAWHLGPAELQLVSILGTPQPHQPWASFATYGQIYEQASDRDRQITLAFCTPTTFRLTKYDCALPSRELVFHSLLKRWNQYSAIPFEKTLYEVLYPSRFDIYTEVVSDSRSKLIGCVGTITFQVLGEIEPEVIKQINTLADFALYSGIGRKTPMGMGHVRRIYTHVK